MVKPESILIRESNEADVTALANLMDQLGYSISHDDMLDRIHRYQDNAQYKSWVAELEGNVIGALSVIVIDFFHRKGRSMRIGSLVIDEGHRRQGIGRLLLAHAEAYAQAQGCDMLELTSDMRRAKLGSHDFYTSLGYQDMTGVKKYFVKKL